MHFQVLISSKVDGEVDIWLQGQDIYLPVFHSKINDDDMFERPHLCLCQGKQMENKKVTIPGLLYAVTGGSWKENYDCPKDGTNLLDTQRHPK